MIRNILEFFIANKRLIQQYEQERVLGNTCKGIALVISSKKCIECAELRQCFERFKINVENVNIKPLPVKEVMNRLNDYKKNKDKVEYVKLPVLFNDVKYDKKVSLIIKLVLIQQFTLDEITEVLINKYDTLYTEAIYKYTRRSILTIINHMRWFFIVKKENNIYKIKGLKYPININ